MKYLLFFLVVPFACISCGQPQEKPYNGWPNHFLKGNVRSIHSSYYQADASGAPGWKWNVGDDSQTFNRQGNLLVQHTSLGDADRLQAKVEYTYQEGKLTGWNAYKRDTLIENGFFDYENNRISGSRKYDEQGEQVCTTVYTYHGDKIATITECNSGQAVVMQTTYHYKNDVLSYKMTEFPLSRVFRKTVYDPSGWVETEIQAGYTEGDTHHITESSTYAYLFDEKGNWIQYTLFENGEAQHILKRDIEYF